MSDLYEHLSDAQWSELLQQASLRTSERVSRERALGNIVDSSPRSGDGLHYPAKPDKNQAALPLFKPRELRDSLRFYQAGSQARACGTGIGSPAVLAHVPTSSGAPGGSAWAVVGGESTCQSPRCPKCRNSIMSKRGQEIQFLMDKWRESEPEAKISMITLTVPHTSSDALLDVLGSTQSRSGIRGALALLKQYRLWRNNVAHFVAGLEITHGKNGWHCHFHVLVFHVAKLPKYKWFESWREACLQAGLGSPSTKRGVVIQPAENAAKYMAKWSIASEAVGGNRKYAKAGNRAIFELETAVASGDKGLITFLIGD